MTDAELERIFAEQAELPWRCGIGRYLPKTSDLLVLTLEQLGGHAHLSSIYERFKQNRVHERPDLPWRSEEDLRGLVRSGLRAAAKNCNPDAAHDYFTRPEKGSGYWQLNPGVRYDYKYRAARCKRV